ncbi:MULTISPECIES: MBL fold metallo-hydrolase [Chlamydia]|uniref:Metallo-beta-lactamase superfamily protein n=2 Tax=Chlamydia TaxID=810 RepID=A0ABP2X3H5_CHLPS|nr:MULTISPECIES: MBL fold metallo-hydrolase [Chlamydia]AFS22473.1 metallo-beta-lactamase superfamily protein [Chlamydia psittaci VS225]EPJ32158.1 metallo-beta-lactamase superfamily protein [Chlamydia psittaci 06-1683]EPP32166.1 metallo-beta-lactamase superfamily protein [Chlamydia psittaci C1/97]AFS20384.1 metallo-beta-lactamase superfamily protein [Chlamydia psittaci GR9]AFS23647.1 metallo-beta-lactamase superfamily protein [Chlamydia psittaci WS/RT/E30]
MEKGVRGDVSSGKLTFLGSGNPEGIPVAFCPCEMCKGKHIRRLRSSVLIEWAGKHILIDVGPDFRQQMLENNIEKLDGVFLTHPHYDHIGGMDDLRVWYVLHQQSLPVVLSSFTYKYLCKAREHLVLPPDRDASLSAALNFTILNEDYGESTFLDLPFTYVTYHQKSCEVMGYRFGNLAYLTDMNRYDHKIFSYLSGVDTLILSVSSTRPPQAFAGLGHAHLTMSQAEDFASLVGAKKLIFTHISHHLQKELVDYPNKLWAYDGMEVSWSFVR